MATADQTTPTGCPSLRYCVFDVQPVRSGSPAGRIARTGFWLSLFRFQGATGHAPVLPVVVPGDPKDCSRQIALLESLLRRSEGLGRPFRRDAYRIRPPWHRQRVDCNGGENDLGRLRQPSQGPPAGPLGLRGARVVPSGLDEALQKDSSGGTEPHPRIPAGTTGSRFHAKTRHSTLET
jgi:hypothetical protein